MSVIYEPKGKAKEYCELACNLYRGCGHGCHYCYAPDVLRKTGLTRADFVNHPAVRKDILLQLEKAAPKFRGREVQLCFTCDPYQPIDAELQITRRAIRILKDNDITVRILTKGGNLSTRDFDLLEPGRDWYGASLTFTDNEDSRSWEPDGALPGQRFDALISAKSWGLKTWASLEPVIDPAQSLEIIRRTHKYVNVFKVGKWNHSPAASHIDWADFATKAVTLLDEVKADYYIKQDLAAFLQR